MTDLPTGELTPAARDDLVALYQDLHAHPELAFAERRTAGIAAERARRAGFQVTEGVGETGVVAVLRNGSGPTVLLRADMDALPVVEATGLPYASQVRSIEAGGAEVGVMHACGHDMHVTWLVGALDAMAAGARRWSGTLTAVFQPAEEGRGGAQAMLDDGLFGRFGAPDVVLGQHVVPLPAGQIGYCPGPAMAGSDSVTIRLFGRGGHGSRPETTVDPVVLAAATIMRLQTVVAREVAPAETAVLTVGAVHAGTKHNIIAAEAELQLTIRAFSPAVRQRLLDAITRIVNAEAAASDAVRPPEIVLTEGYPVVVNDPQTSAAVAVALAARLGAQNVTVVPQVTGSEDFGAYGTAAGVPSCFWFVGGADPDQYAAAVAAGRVEQDIPTNHSPLYAPVLHPTLPTGITALTTAALAWLT